MSLRRFFLLPLAMLALAFPLMAPASALERSPEVYQIAALDFDLVAVSVADEAAVLRDERFVTRQRISAPAHVALGPIYHLSLMTDRQSLVHPPHRRC